MRWAKSKDAIIKIVITCPPSLSLLCDIDRYQKHWEIRCDAYRRTAFLRTNRFRNIFFLVAMRVVDPWRFARERRNVTRWRMERPLNLVSGKKKRGDGYAEASLFPPLTGILSSTNQSATRAVWRERRTRRSWGTDVVLRYARLTCSNLFYISH